MKLSNIIMIIGAISISGLFLFPLWSITLEAPQYPTPLSMDIYINKFEDYRPHDIKNINLMNHYVGMDPIPETIPEFTIFPIVIGVMSVVGIAIGIFKSRKWFLGWFITMTLLAIAGLIDFYIWEYEYGHNLDPHAIMKFTDPDGNPMGFQPPFFGTEQILNFVAHSYPGIGAFLLGAGLLLSLIAYIVAGREKSNIKV
ncbi:hypothetical protein GO491_08985 [Flavobacteriaceae bacterium Ap0902]|nr:hypothetical protein [Flavobacteriaceae bacterium Ap0902]